jgi:hypothetical protein
LKIENRNLNDVRVPLAGLDWNLNERQQKKSPLAPFEDSSCTVQWIEFQLSSLSVPLEKHSPVEVERLKLWGDKNESDECKKYCHYNLTYVSN